MKDFKQWDGFAGRLWKEGVDVRDFIQNNYTPYDGDRDFLAPPTERTLELWRILSERMKLERERNGVYDIDEKTISTITSHEAGYIDRELETIVGLQTDAPLKRAIMPFGGFRLIHTELEAYGRKMDPAVEHLFEYRKTHNDGVFDVYTDEMKKVRHAGVITGLPDNYGRGRIIGDYRRVPLYGVDFLIEAKKQAKREAVADVMDSDMIRKREEIAEQIKALGELKAMAAKYGFDISRPAQDTKEAIQWLYFGYLAAVKEQNGAAMSIGRISTFLDCYAERDLAGGKYTEEEIQEFVDHFIMKLRIVRFLRTPAYDELFSGDPTWVTESVGGMSLDGRHMVTKMSYRFLHTLVNLGPAPEPNLTVLWSVKLPENFKKFCADISIGTSSIQYENDDLMRVKFGDDYGIACCVSAMRIGKQMQFFGARCNMAKILLMALNGGRDEKSGDQLGPEMPVVGQGALDYGEVKARLDKYMAWIAGEYVKTMNVIHYMHDKYAYEKIQMALHDTDVHRFMAFGMAGLSVVTDSLSAIRYAKVKPVFDDRGMVCDFETEGEFPCYGNDDDRADSMAKDLCHQFITELRKHKTYRGAEHTLSILTITSNVVYGKKTGNTPDGRRAGTPFAPGANPMHGREKNGALASLNSVSKLNYDDCRDGISNTFTITPATLGGDEETRIENLTALLDGYFNIDEIHAAHHLNVNVLNRETLEDAMEHPELYPNLTIRVSGYAVNFVRLSRAQQLEVIARTFHEAM